MSPPRDPKAFTEWFELDYFRRPRPFRRSWGVAIAIVSVLCAAGLAYTFTPMGRTAYQAGPLCTAHAMFADRCEVCHTDAFRTAARLWPGNSDMRAVKDSVCLECHEAGRHSPKQDPQFNDSNHQAVGCAGCHREHRGAVSLSRISDKHCTECHANLTVVNGSPTYHARISQFPDHHPPFGAWRKKELTDPGTIQFNHQRHLNIANELSNLPPERVAVIQPFLKDLQQQSCTYCHQSDTERKYMRPVRYQDHCAGCHPLAVPPPESTPQDIRTAFVSKPVPHPAPGQSAGVVRGALIDKFTTLLANSGEMKPPDTDPIRPAILGLNRPILNDEQRDQLTALLKTAERLLFDMPDGCARCHGTDDRTKRTDGLPTIPPPRILDRWKDVSFPVDRFDGSAFREQKNRWYPHAKFSHDSHRLLSCVECHEQALTSTKTADLLIPRMDTCANCHSPTGGARHDCLECHNYHDHSREPRRLDGLLKPDLTRSTKRLTDGNP